jgi:hypothetical protein
MMNARYDTSVNIAESTCRARVFLGEIEAFVGEAPEQDDMTMILLENGDRAAASQTRPIVQAVEVLG